MGGGKRSLEERENQSKPNSIASKIMSWFPKLTSEPSKLEKDQSDLQTTEHGSEEEDFPEIDIQEIEEDEDEVEEEGNSLSKTFYDNEDTEEILYASSAERYF